MDTHANERLARAVLLGEAGHTPVAICRSGEIRCSVWRYAMLRYAMIRYDMLCHAGPEA